MRLTVPIWAMTALAFSSAGAVASAAPPTEACSVLSTAQVSAAIGTNVADGKYIMPNLKKTCTWNISTGGAVTLQLQSVDFFNAGKGSLASAERTSVGGVGDEAYYLGLGPTTGLVVKKGAGAFKVSVYSPKLGLDQRKDIEKALAQKALSKF